MLPVVWGTSRTMDLRARYQEIQDRSALAAESVGRDPASVCLIAVSKTVPIEAIQRLYDLGHRDFGESRLNEALPKIEALPDDIRWHFIGNLQSNKARKIGERFAVVHTLASEQSLRELAKCQAPVPTFVEVNIASEPQKAGIFPDTLDKLVENVIDCPQVQLLGLMTIGPANDEPEESRQWFRKLAELQAGRWESLSMGMSHDFEVAIQEGSTHIRVGTALFGERA